MVRLYSRINGWSLPPHPLQILAWAILLCLSLAVYLLLIPVIKSPNLRLYLYAALSALILLTVGIKVILTTIDPSDDFVMSKIRHQPRPKFDRTKCRHVIDEHHFCNVCEMFIHPTSKHCRQCNKCVLKFDHHCKWLNNCIGKKNYKCFLAFVVIVAVTSLWIAVLSSLLLVFFCTVPNMLLRDNGFFLLCGALVPGSTWVALTASTGLISAIVAVLALHLLIFHTRLVLKGLTTYAYITAQRRNDENGHGELKAGKVRLNSARVLKAWLHANVFQHCISNSQQKVGKVCPVGDDGSVNPEKNSTKTGETAYVNLPSHN